MGFWQNLADSYDKNADALKKTYPLSTTSISNNGDIIAVIVIDGNGKFLRVDKIEKKSNPTKKSPGVPLVNMTAPVTEESLGRSSGISPHPVFDQYEYLKGSGEKFDTYILQLKDFK
ncbi:MAG: type I-C CRISPR-associated protein Cas8c/Csd1, partial [Candidatus Omnitrophota bacterium]